MNQVAQSIFTKLQHILQQHLLLAHRLARLAKAQSEAIIAGDVVRLTSLEAEQRQTIQQQEALEADREKATKELARLLHLTPEARLSEMIAKMPPTEKRTFSQLRKELLSVQEEIKRTKEENTRLLHSAIEYVQFSMESLTRAIFKPKRYGTNLAALAAPALLLDSRA
jgi:seryl-tRNA synthetase